MNDGNHIQTITGLWVDPLSGNVALPRLEDIAHSLSLINRFNGHTVTPWSVAAHSLCCYTLATPPAKRLALFHDAAEAYCGDWQRPVKHRLPGEFRDAETKLAAAIYAAHGVNAAHGPEVKHIDDLMCQVERYVLCNAPAVGNDDPLWRQACELVSWYQYQTWRGIKEQWLQAEAQCRSN